MDKATKDITTRYIAIWYLSTSKITTRDIAPRNSANMYISSRARVAELW